ncbi:MAG: amino acid-binding protein [Verrucomicrobiae bacterium]|nr:amino acid-binding protein [Verrucomicrobiae bacterium]
MKRTIQKQNVWSAAVEDRPGALAEKLAALAEAGADLEFVLARRLDDKPGNGIVFVAPIRGARQTKAATANGFSACQSLFCLRVEGRNRPGEGAVHAKALANEGINLRGFAAATIGARYVLHVAFDSEADLKKAQRILARC